MLVSRGKTICIVLMGLVVCMAVVIMAIVSLMTPYWVYINDTLESTVSGLTEPTEVEYNYGFLGYCLKLSQKLLTIDECGDKQIDIAEEWERMSFWLLCSGTMLAFIAACCGGLNLLWNELPPLIGATAAALVAGVLFLAGVALYEVRASKQILFIAQLVEQNFLPEYFYSGFRLAIACSGGAMVAGLVFLLSAWTRKPTPKRIKPPKPQKPKQRPEKKIDYASTILPVKYDAKSPRGHLFTIRSTTLPDIRTKSNTMRALPDNLRTNTLSIIYQE